MPAKNRTSISLSDEQIKKLDSIAIHQHKSRAEIIRIIISEYLVKHPDRFRLPTKLE